MAKISLPGETWKKRKRRQLPVNGSVNWVRDTEWIVFRAPVGTGLEGWERIGQIED